MFLTLRASLFATFMPAAALAPSRVLLHDSCMWLPEWRSVLKPVHLQHPRGGTAAQECQIFP